MVHKQHYCCRIGPASLAHKNEAGGSWGQEVHLLHVNIQDLVLFWS